jgi:hypothetical protein
MTKFPIAHQLTISCVWKEVLVSWSLGNWNLFGACLPAGRQGIWLLEFLINPSYALQEKDLPDCHPHPVAPDL